MFGVAGGASGLPDGFADKRDNGVIGDASLSGTVVVHDVAETQRALLHSVLPTGLHFRFALCAHRLISGRITFFGRGSFLGQMRSSDAGGIADVQVTGG